MTFAHNWLRLTKCEGSCKMDEYSRIMKVIFEPISVRFRAGTPINQAKMDDHLTDLIITKEISEIFNRYGMTKGSLKFFLAFVKQSFV